MLTWRIYFRHKPTLTSGWHEPAWVETAFPALHCSQQQPWTSRWCMWCVSSLSFCWYHEYLPIQLFLSCRLRRTCPKTAIVLLFWPGKEVWGAFCCQDHRKIALKKKRMHQVRQKGNVSHWHPGTLDVDMGFPSESRCGQKLFLCKKGIIRR